MLKRPGPLLLDFRRPPMRWALGFAIAGFGLAVATAVLLDYADLTAEVDRWELKVSRLDRKPDRKAGKLPESAADSQETATRVRRANLVLNQLAVPWEDMFGAIERASDGTVALLAIEPDAAKQVVRIGAEAKTPEAMLAYLKRLQEQKPFSEALLTNHQIQAEDPERPYRFILQARWNATP